MRFPIYTDRLTHAIDNPPDTTVVVVVVAVAVLMVATAIDCVSLKTMLPVQPTDILSAALIALLLLGGGLSVFHIKSVTEADALVFPTCVCFSFSNQLIRILSE